MRSEVQAIPFAWDSDILPLAIIFMISEAGTGSTSSGTFHRPAENPKTLDNFCAVVSGWISWNILLIKRQICLAM